MNEPRVVRAVHDFLHREFGAQTRKTLCSECWREDFGGRADLALIQSRSDVIHAVEAKDTLEGSFDAIGRVPRYPANYRWITLPEDEYVPEAGLLKACSEEGIGALLVHEQVRKPVEVERSPTYQAGISSRSGRGLKGSGMGRNNGVLPKARNGSFRTHEPTPFHGGGPAGGADAPAFGRFKHSVPDCAGSAIGRFGLGAWRPFGGRRDGRRGIPVH